MVDFKIRAMVLLDRGCAFQQVKRCNCVRIRRPDHNRMLI
jgi:hypothetical protein